MDRCYKLIVSIIIFIFVIVPSEKVLAEDNDLEDDFLPAVKTNSKEQRKAVINLTNEEILLLSKLVTSEARGESYEGQVAVAAVAINRVKDSRFPNSIEDVIYQKNAFSVVKNGTINMDPTDEAYKAAQDALYGADPTEKSVYFWNPKISTCKWIQTLSPHMRIGNHVFAK